MAAALLSKEVHRDIVLTDVAIESKNIPTDFEIDISNLGIWIDPIGKSKFLLPLLVLLLFFTLLS